MATLILASPFRDHAVLQRDKPIPVWGRALPLENLEVSFRGQERKVRAGLDGKWRVELSPMPASHEGADLVVRGASIVTVRDVLVGELWLCSGQSNMTFNVARTDGAEEEMAAAHFPLLRHFGVAREPRNDKEEFCDGEWKVCTPEEVGAFSAVAFFFGRDLHQALGIPVGLILSGCGGTPIESWLSVESLGSRPEFSVIYDRWKQTLADWPANQAIYEAALERWTKSKEIAAQAGGSALLAFQKTNPLPIVPTTIRPASAPSGLYNSMIHPLAPFAMRGILWYQGESNAVRAGEYHALFAELIRSWRSLFVDEELPFYWVQLPNFIPPDQADWVGLRAAQAMALSSSHTGQVITIDVGDPQDIHPTRKRDIGLRLALLAKAQVYGFADEYSGPIPDTVIWEPGQLRIHFKHASGGLILRAGASSFEIAGASDAFFPAVARIEGDALVVSAAEIKDPAAVRYAWADNPTATLFNGAGLPAAPFHLQTHL